MRLIDAVVLSQEIASLQVTIGGRLATWDEAKSSVLRIIDEQKTADAVKVVRCKDCRFFDPHSFTNPFPEEYRVGFCSNWRRETQGGDFCSNGRIKDCNDIRCRCRSCGWRKKP